RGLAAAARCAALAARLEPAHAATILDRVREWATDRTRADVEALGEKHGFAAARVASAADRYDDPHLRARGATWEYEDPTYGPMVEQGPAPKLSTTRGRIRWAAQPVGWHNDHVFRTILGLSTAELRDLEARGVVGRWADRVGARPPEGVTPP